MGAFACNCVREGINGLAVETSLRCISYKDNHIDLCHFPKLYAKIFPHVFLIINCISNINNDVAYVCFLTTFKLSFGRTFVSVEH